MSTLAVNTITNAAGGNTAQINGMTPTADSLQGFRNRIINGDMRIDQRNAGAALTVNSGAQQYAVDRFLGQGQVTDGVFTVQQSSVAPTGFSNSLLATVTTADASIGATQFYFLTHRIEGYNVSDLGFGAAGASSVTLSFWVRSSLTGTFGGSLINDAADRSYPFTYTISAADTWEQKTITVAGDTSGTWLKTNGIGCRIYWNIGAGSSLTAAAGAWTAQTATSATGSVNLIATDGATFYITGVQLEAGSVATPFERRPYGTELALCQRYYYKMLATNADTVFGNSYNASTTEARGLIIFPTTMRAAPTALEQSGTAGDYRVAHQATATNCSAVPQFSSGDIFNSSVNFTVASGLTAGQGSRFRAVNSSAFLAWSAEL
jgi:hypothetical protein